MTNRLRYFFFFLGISKGLKLIPQNRKVIIHRRVNSLIFGFLLIACCGSLVSCSSFQAAFTPGPELSYSVKSGDSLYGISKRFEISMLELQKINRIDDPHKLEVGQILRIPIREDSTQAASGGPYVSAATAKKERSGVVFPSPESYGVRMVMPLEGSKIGSRFGYRGSRFHEGLDLIAKKGTPVYAAHDGVVIFSGQKLSGYGKMVAIKKGRIMTVYAHNSKNLVERGDIVSQGSKIAEVGATGRASGPHLHFEVRVQADDDRYYAVEPLEFFEEH